MEKDMWECTELRTITHCIHTAFCCCCFPSAVRFTFYTKWLTSRCLGCLPTDAYPKTEMIYTWTKGPRHSVEVPPESSSLVQYDLIGQTVSSETIKSITGEAPSPSRCFELPAEFTWILHEKRLGVWQIFYWKHKKLSCLKTDAFPSCALFSTRMTGQIPHRSWIRSGLGAPTPASGNQTLLASAKHFRGPFSSIYRSTRDDFSSRALQQVVAGPSENGQAYWAGY